MTAPLVASAISNGVVTQDATFTVHVHGLREGDHMKAHQCSGVLLSRRWVLTARHCFNGVTAPFEALVTVPPPGMDEAEITVRTHPGPLPFEFAAPEEIFRTDVAVAFNMLPLDPFDEGSRGTDLALVRLARPVPADFAQPLHPPLLGEPACPAELDGIIVGYGRMDFSDNLFHPDVTTRERNFKSVGDWDRFSVAGGGVYRTFWGPYFLVQFPLVDPLIIEEIEGSYNGMLRSDSGGPLVFQHADGSLALCGVASAPFPEISLFTFDLGNDYAAVDSDEALAFIRAHVVRDMDPGPGVNEWFEGECPPPNQLETADEEPSDDPDHPEFVGDGIPDACDNCRPQDCGFPLTAADCRNENQLNVDGDSKGDVCDVCPLSQIETDQDFDGCIDGCDPCLDDAGPNCGDRDRDGFCNSVDNCEETPNTQRNANFDAEDAHGAPIWGNACDPVPVAEVLEDPVLALSTPPCKFFLYNDFGVRPLASHPNEVESTVSAPQSAGSARTPVRFCHEQLPTVDCDDVFAFNDGLLMQASSAANELPSHRFHRMTFDPFEGNGTNPNGLTLSRQHNRPAWTEDADGDPVPGYAQSPDEELEASFNWTWHFMDDFDRWTTDNNMFVGVPPGGAEDLAGVLWVHSDTAVGDTDLDLDTGFHGSQLANEHLIDFRPFRVECSFFIAAQHLIPDKIIILLSLPDPAPFRRAGATRGESDVLVRDVDDGALWGTLADRGQYAEVVTDRLGPNLLALLNDPGSRIVNVADPMPLMGAGTMFPHAALLDAIGGSQILGLVTGDRGHLGTDGDRPICPVDAVSCRMCPAGLCSPDLSACCDLSCTSDADCPPGAECALDLGICRQADRAGSPHAIGYAATLTRMRRGVFVVGGDDVATGEPTGEIWFASVEGGDWVEVPSPIRPKKTHAATYSFATDKLYFVDEVSEVPPDANAGSKKKATVCHVHGSGKSKTLSISKSALAAHLGHGDALGPCPEAIVRLVEVGLGPFTARVVASHPRNEWEQFFLSVDLTGALLFSASSRQEHRHRIARIALRGSEPTLAGARSGHGSLAFAPIADEDGYTLLFHGDEQGEDDDEGDDDDDDDDDDAAEQQTFVRERKRSLGLKDATFSSLAKGP